ncbi:MAG: 5-formyltetrahydrofolate cyclo-ligase [bacterium]
MSEDLRNNKRRLRRRILAERDRLTADQIALRSARLHAALFALPEYQAAATVHLFAPFGSEVNTRPILRQLWDRQRCAVLPRVAPNRQLDHLAVGGWQDLEPGFRGIPEPSARCRETRPRDVDLVLVPGVAFDRRGGRLGYGGGYYDRFLQDCPAPRVALTFALQLVDEVPREPHDLLVNKIVTDEGVIEI